MAVVFLALNGDGLGHLVRTTTVCRALAAAGEKPVIFSQSIFPLDGHSQFPGTRIPSLWKAPRSVRHRVAAQLRSMAEISLPAVLVEDTHPNPIALPRTIRRVLQVRPTSFDYLLQLNRPPSPSYDAFLLCDTPNSPTWPYSAAETRTILTWDKWHVIGPIYRTPSEADIRGVRKRYGITGEERVCVFSMGGGGGDRSHPEGKDAERFVVHAADIAEQLQRDGRPIRLIFVQGPYFPAEIGIDNQFEVVRQEPLMPALLAAADGAVIRAGFNTTWECISGGTPFLPFVGTTFGEPVPERLQGMQAQGLLPSSVDVFWNDERWRCEFRRSCRRIVEQNPGTPDPLQLRRLILKRSDRVQVVAEPQPPSRRTSPLQRFYHPLPFTIRIDDVVAPEPTLTWLLKLLAARELRASLEVVPYLLEFDEAFLNEHDPTGDLFEVSQHGYAHLPRSGGGRGWHEFRPGSARPNQDEVATISWGKARLERVFPQRFKGGFSPPFDALPMWLPDLWRDLGGVFLSRVAPIETDYATPPMLSAGIDPWDWKRGHTVAAHEMNRQLARYALRHRRVGIVLHPRCLRHPRERARFVALLDMLQRCSIATAALSKLAMGEITPSRRSALWALAALTSWRF